MKKIKELVTLLNRNKIKSIEVIDGNLANDSKLMVLYDGIQKGEITNDKEAIECLYPDTLNKNAYYKLKHTLKERLYNTVFFIDVKSKKYSDIHKAKLYIQKQICLLNILITKGLKQNAIYIAKKALVIAIEYQFTIEQLTIARILRTHSAAMQGDNKEFLIYDEMVKNSISMLAFESEAESAFQEILMLYVNSKSDKPYVYAIADKHIANLKKANIQNPTANWLYHFTMVNIAKNMSVNDYSKTLIICQEALNKIKQLKFQHTKSLINISSQAIACCVQLKLYEQGEQNILLGLNIMQEGIFNWFKYKELHLSLCFHTQRYNKAWEIYSEVTVNKKFKNLNENTKEIWKIYEAWLFFFINSGKIVLAEKSLKDKNFKIARYANDVPIFSKDKRGLNVPILVSQVILLIQQKKYDTVIDRMEAIAKYKDRYIKREDNFRTNVFIKMLLLIPKCQFQKKMLIKNTTKEMNLLKGKPIEVANQNMDIEIIPYEDVWNILLEQL